MIAHELPPPATNRGVEKQVSLRIHWIECTFKQGVPVVYHPNLTQVKTECKPFNAYNIGVRYDDGRVELSHTVRKEMGVHVILSGAALDNFPIEPMEYLSHLLKNFATITRIDMAVDAIGYGLKPERATSEIKLGRVKTRSRKFPIWRDAKGRGYTQYIGTKSSECYVRIYDKGAEMETSLEWSRVEIVFGGRRAHSAAKIAAQGEDFRSLILGFVDFDNWEEWRVVFNARPVKVKSEVKDTNTQKWLLRVAAASLAREIHLAGDDDFYFRFIDAVKLKLEQLRDDYENVA